MVAAAVTVAGSLLVLSAGSVRESRETGALDAPAIAAFLAARVEPDDRILATGSDTILEYYLRRAPAWTPGRSSTRTSHTCTRVVVNTLGGRRSTTCFRSWPTRAGWDVPSSSRASTRDGCTW